MRGADGVMETDSIKHGSYARSHGSSLRPWPGTRVTRHRLGISSRTSWSETPSLTVAQPICLECKIKKMSGEKSRLIKLPSKGKDQMTRKKIVYLNQLMMQRQASLGVECGRSIGRGLICLLQPRISGFHSSYIPSHHQLQTLKAEQSAPIIFCTLAGTVSIEKKLHLKIYPGIMQ